jgi:hypothetical protein
MTGPIQIRGNVEIWLNYKSPCDPVNGAKRLSSHTGNIARRGIVIPHQYMLSSAPSAK